MNPILSFCTPELIVMITGIGSLLTASFLPSGFSARVVRKTALIGCILALMWLIESPSSPISHFYHQWIHNDFTRGVKAFLVGLTFCYLACEKNHQDSSPELIILVIFSLLGGMIAISSGGFLSFFMGLELQSLSLYILVTFREGGGPFRGEAGIKYFLLGALSTTIMVYGMSFIYGATGVINFDALAQISSSVPPVSPTHSTNLLILGLLLVFCGLFFKLSLVPFHLWTPDVYEGTSLKTLAFLASVVKVGGVCLFVKLAFGPFFGIAHSYRSAFVLMGFLSLIFGSVGLVRQSQIKGLMAYSAILNMGYIILGVMSETPESMLIYTALYGLSTLGALLCCGFLKGSQGVSPQRLDELKGLIKVNPGLAFCLICFLFSMAGIPPLAGFLAKIYIVKSVASFHGGLAIGAALLSVVALAAYLKIIKAIVMDDPEESSSLMNRERVPPGVILLVASLIFVSFFPHKLTVGLSPLLKVFSRSSAS